MLSEIEKPEYFECACRSDEHTIKFQLLDVGTDDRPIYEVYTSVFLNRYGNIFKRIWVAIKYVFGYKCKYGHWDCWLLHDDDLDRLLDLLTEYKKIRNPNKH